MRKLLSVLVLLVTLVTLAACGGDKPQKIQISYASWGDSVFEQKMIDKFMEKYPNIEVYMDETITGSGGEFTANLVTAAQAGTVPDVFAIDNVPTAIDKGLTKNIADLWDKDEDAKKVYPNIANTGVYGDVRYAAPSYQFIKGVYLNKTVLEDAGLQLPSKDWTYQEMIQLARDFTDPSQHMYGFNGGLNFDAVLPSLNDANKGYHTWDGEKFNFTSQAWIDGLKLNRQLRQEGIEEAMTAEEKLNLFGNEQAWPFLEGRTLMGIDGSWNIPYIQSEFTKRGYEFAFYPYPGGSAGQRIPVILDYMCVSAKTEFPEEAFLLLKWMTFGEDGWKARLEIMKEMNTPVIHLPVANYPEVWAELETMSSSVDGMKENIQLVQHAVPDTDKWLPGYSDFWAWLGEDANPYKDQWDSMTPEQIAPIWEENMNRLINEAYVRLSLTK